MILPQYHSLTERARPRNHSYFQRSRGVLGISLLEKAAGLLRKGERYIESLSYQLKLILIQYVSDKYRTDEVKF